MHTINMHAIEPGYIENKLGVIIRRCTDDGCDHMHS